MDKIQKLLKKISAEDRKVLLALINIIIVGDKTLNIIAIKNTNFFRVKYKQFRIIFHKEENKNIIDSIRLRNENTYQNL